MVKNLFQKKTTPNKAVPLEQLTKVYKPTCFSTPAQGFQKDAAQMGWNVWRVQAATMTYGLFGLPELVAVYQRDERFVQIKTK